MDEDHKQLLSSSSDNKSNHHSSTSNTQDDKISHPEKTLQEKEEAYRNETDTFLKKKYKTKILSSEEEIVSVNKEAASEKLEKALQAKNTSTGMSL